MFGRPLAVSLAFVSVGRVKDAGVDRLGMAADENGEKHTNGEEKFYFHLFFSF
jgi:hypothetical protein